MVDVTREPNIRSHRWYQKRYHVRLTKDELSRDWIEAEGIDRIDRHIFDVRGAFDAPNGASPVFAYHADWDRAWYDQTYQYEAPNGVRPVMALNFKADAYYFTET